MNCPKCGAPLTPGTSFCTNCGSAISMPAPTPDPAPAPQPVQQQSYNTYPATPPVTPGYQQTNISAIPPEYKPLSPWAYFGYTLLFSIPVVGFICLIIFSIDSGNINRRNFARSFWIALLVGLILCIAVGVLTAILGVSIADEIGNEFSNDFSGGFGSF